MSNPGPLDEPDDEPPDPPWLDAYACPFEVHVEDNPTVAVFYGLDGEPLIELTERASIPFGFQRP